MNSASADHRRMFWDDYSEIYSKREFLTIQPAKVLLSHLEIETAKSILEVGCGLGTCSRLIANKMNPETNLTITDFSSKMISATCSKFLLPTKHIVIETADALELKYKDKSFDRYISNLVLHLVVDPDLMLKEARRVLSDDGIACFSIWGDPQNSLLFYLHGNGFQQQFELSSDLHVLKSRFIKAGFNRVVMWRFQSQYELWNVQKVLDFWEDGKISRECVECAFANGIPIGVEFLIIFCKP